jgi:CheY-like chemotaxis protein
MKKRLLWIEDDYYAIKGLVRPLELNDFTVDVATSAKDGHKLAQNWQEYDLLVVDVIVPVSEDDGNVLPEIQKWEDSGEYVGIGLTKWLITELKVERPILLMSVVTDPIKRFGLTDMPNLYYLSKKGLLPSKVKDEVFRILKIEQ